jgi:hypothetical protein
LNSYSRKIIQREQMGSNSSVMYDEGESITDREDALKSFSYDHKALLTENTVKTHIRLVYPCRAEPGEFSYSFELKSVPLDDSTTEFIALSYTWGEDGPSFPIALNGQKLFITKSLATALFHIYSNRPPRPIWIDQISIDQSNKDEKNFQVPLMSKIYSTADEVLIWLGESADGSDELMDALSLAGLKSRECGIEELLTRENWEKCSRWVAGKDQNDLPRRRPFKELCQEVVPPIDIHALKAWFLRPWFRRVWTIQEYSLAKEPKFICGGKSILGDDVKNAWIVWSNAPPYIRLANSPPKETAETAVCIPTPESLAKHREIIKENKSWLSEIGYLQELLNLDPIAPLTHIRKKKEFFDSSRGPGMSHFKVLEVLNQSVRKCKLPQDWIYGLLAIPNDRESLQIVPDYSLPYQTVYARFARKVIENGNLEILRYSQFPKSYQSELPSWAPDWQSRPITTFDYTDDKDKIARGGETGHLFSASKQTTVCIKDVGDERLLALQGFVVDEIEELGSPWLGRAAERNTPHHIETPSFLTSVRLLCLLSTAKNHPIYPTAQRRLEAIWRTPIADIMRVESATQYNVRATEKHEQAFRHVWTNGERQQERSIMSADAEAELSRSISREVETGAKLYRASMYNLQEKRPYITKLGYVGLGPRSVKPGDKVVVFKGAVIPFVIREVDRGYFLLGESYCDGIMDGEIVGQREEETIVLV